MAEVMKFKCGECDEVHEGLPHWGCNSPDYYEPVPHHEREQRCKLSPDFCIVDESFFVRAVLLVPVAETEQPFGWGVWSTLSEPNFQRYYDLYEAEDMGDEGPYFGWFSNRLPFYPNTLNLKVQVHLQNGGMRPLLELEPCDHPLALDQMNGMSWDHAVTIAGRLLHDDLEFPD